LGAKMPGVSTRTIWLWPSMAMPAHAGAGGLGLVRYNGDLGRPPAHDQRGLARVGRAYDSGKNRSASPFSDSALSGKLALLRPNPFADEQTLSAGRLLRLLAATILADRGLQPVDRTAP